MFAAVSDEAKGIGLGNGNQEVGSHGNDNRE